MRVNRTTSPKVFGMGAICLICATSFFATTPAVAKQKPGSEQKTTESAGKDASDKAYRNWLDAEAIGIASDPGQASSKKPSASTPPPAGWFIYPARKLENSSDWEKRCFNYSKNDWDVFSEEGVVQIRLLNNHENRPKPDRPLNLKREHGMTGLASSLHIGTNWLLGFNGGEFGGGLWLSNDAGSKAKMIIGDDIQGMLPFGDNVLILSGLAHMTMDYGNAYILSKPDGMEVSLEHASSLISCPTSLVQAPDGTVLFTTMVGLNRISQKGEITYLYWFPRWARYQYPNSVTVTKDGFVYVGMRMFVHRLNLEKHTEDWLLPNNCRKFSLANLDCVCKP